MGSLWKKFLAVVIYVFAAVIVMTTAICMYGNRNYFIYKKFVDRFDMYIQYKWGFGGISVNDREKKCFIHYNTSDFFDERDMEVNDNNPYIILGKARNSAKKFLEENKNYKLNNGYIIELEIKNSSRSHSMYLTNKIPEWLSARFDREKDKISKLDDKKIFPYLITKDVALKELRLFDDLQILIVDKLVVDDIEDFKIFNNLKYLDYRNIVNNTDIPDDDMQEEIQKRLPDCVIQDSKDSKCN